MSKRIKEEEIDHNRYTVAACIGIATLICILSIFIRL